VVVVVLEVLRQALAVSAAAEMVLLVQPTERLEQPIRVAAVVLLTQVHQRQAAAE
jgi:hypothetical protein